MKPIITKFIQVGIVTPDTDATVATICEELNLGPFKVLGFTYPAIFDTTINNKPAPWTVKVAVGWLGNLPFEVIQPTGGKTYDEAYLDKFKVAGIQQLVMDKGKWSYSKAKKLFSNAGTPVLIEAKTNIGFYIGPFRFPAFPKFLANLFATVFGYINSLDLLKVVIEVSKYPFGVSNKEGIDMAAPQYWTKGDKKYFSILPNDSLITGVEGFIVLVNKLEEVKSNYVKLFGVPKNESANEIHYQLENVYLKVVEPDKSSALNQVLVNRGEGVRILQTTPRQKTKEEVAADFQAKGFTLFELDNGYLLFTHGKMPFDILVAY